MAKSVNKVILLGNVGKEPEIKVLPNGQPVANFSIATSDRYKDQQGNFQDRTEWHNITAYGKLAEIVRDYVKKGNKLYIEGRLTTRSWDDKDTQKKVYRTEIVVADLSLLSGRDDQGGGGGNYSGGQASSGGYNQQRSSAPASGGYDQRGPSNYEDSAQITDDDIPF